MLTGSLVIVSTVVLCVAMGFLVHTVLKLSRANVELATRAYDNAETLHDLVSKQAALLAAKDAISYQAIRAMDTLGSYDDGSTQSVDEENAGGDGNYAGIGAAEDPGLEGDPFFRGTVI